VSANRHDCWDRFAPKDRTAQTQAQPQAEKPIQLKDWFSSLVKSHPQPAPSPAAGETKPH
jgi:hypothetical protein